MPLFSIYIGPREYLHMFNKQTSLTSRCSKASPCQSMYLEAPGPIPMSTSSQGTYVPIGIDGSNIRIIGTYNDAHAHGQIKVLKHKLEYVL